MRKGVAAGLPSPACQSASSAADYVPPSGELLVMGDTRGEPAAGHLLQPDGRRPVTGMGNRMTNRNGSERGPEAGRQFQDHLAATLAHELRAPLAAILTSLHLLGHAGVDEAA